MIFIRATVILLLCKMCSPFRPMKYKLTLLNLLTAIYLADLNKIPTTQKIYSTLGRSPEQLEVQNINTT